MLQWDTNNQVFRRKMSQHLEKSERNSFWDSSQNSAYEEVYKTFEVSQAKIDLCKFSVVLLFNKNVYSMTTNSSQAIEIFLCYAREDEKLCQEIEKQLSALKRQGLIDVWYDRQIDEGVEWEKEINKHLNVAQIILLLISPDFMASDYCYGIEMKRAMERHESGEAQVIPIILRRTHWQEAPFGRLQALPKDARPVISKLWDSEDEPFYDIVGGIRRAIENLRTKDISRALPDLNDTTIPPIPIEPKSSNTPPLEDIKPSKNPPGSGRRPKLLFILPCCILIIALVFLTSHFFYPQSPIRITTQKSESIGISDGSFAFDTISAIRSDGSAIRLDGPDKSEAAKKFVSKDFSGAEALWQKAIREDPSDAEALIYQEDRRVLNSKRGYISLVIATILTGDNVQVGRDDLQGAYVAQKEFNSTHSNVPQVRLLIANSGSSDESAAKSVAQQIVDAAKEDPTIVGVMGWPFSASTLSAVDILTQANIPLVSETASTDELTGKSQYFFRIIPPDREQGIINAQYVTQTLHAKQVALFVDLDNAYSKDFARDFESSYRAIGNGNSIVATERYTVGLQGRGQLASLLQDALKHKPDVIYFSGYASDLAVLLEALPSSGPGVTVQIVGGEGLYEGGYSSISPSARAHLGQLRLLAYAYPDEWDIAGLAAQAPPFFQEYKNAFNPSGQPPPKIYRYTRADNDVIMAYDATQVLLTGSTSVLTKGDNVTSNKLQQALKQIDSKHPFQGVSGQIAFGPDGDPVNKAILIIVVDTQGHFQEKALIGGCLQVGHCS